MKRYEDCIEWAKKAQQCPNIQRPAYAHIASAFAHLNRQDEAEEALAAVLEFLPDITVSFVLSSLPITDKAYHDNLVEGLRKAGVPES